MTYQVMFEDAYYKRHNVALCDSEEAIWKAISNYLADMGVKPYYYRSWTNDDGELVIDYSSHSSFFIVKAVI